MTHRARGTFDVKITPHDNEQDTVPNRIGIDKTFHGDLSGTSQGEMLAAGSPVQGSAGYVAIERVSGTLQGRTGSFILQHSGTLNRGAPQLSITVVPDTGTGELAGLAGKLAVDIRAGVHYYDFEYTLDQGSPPAGAGH
jgi:hypothetical protein